MENKILITVNIPRSETKYEIFVPVGKTVFHIFELVEQNLSEVDDEQYISVYNEAGILINPNVLIKDSGLINGSNVIII